MMALSTMLSDDDEQLSSDSYQLNKFILFFIAIPASSNCVFPSQWEGSWFQSGVPQPIEIQGSSMSNRGSCIASDGDKFLMREWVPSSDLLRAIYFNTLLPRTQNFFPTHVTRKRCHRCVVIYEKHKNVLQYKESECEEMDHFKASALSSRSTLIKSDRGVAFSHPNISRSKVSTSDLSYFRSNGDNHRTDCKQKSSKNFYYFHCVVVIFRHVKKERRKVQGGRTFGSKGWKT